jgi:hypothetical protein
MSKIIVKHITEEEKQREGNHSCWQFSCVFSKNKMFMERASVNLQGFSLAERQV